MAAQYLLRQLRTFGTSPVTEFTVAVAGVACAAAAPALILQPEDKGHAYKFGAYTGTVALLVYLVGALVLKGTPFFRERNDFVVDFSMTATMTAISIFVTIERQINQMSAYISKKAEYPNH